MKPHIQREMVKDLKQIAIKYHAHECLRELITICVNNYLLAQEEWERKEWAQEQNKLMQGLPCLPIDGEKEWEREEKKVLLALDNIRKTPHKESIDLNKGITAPPLTKAFIDKTFKDAREILFKKPVDREAEYKEVEDMVDNLFTKRKMPSTGWKCDNCGNTTYSKVKLCMDCQDKILEKE